MKICFIAAGPVEWGSSRLRAFWPADELKRRGHETWVIPYATAEKETELLRGCDAYVFQKRADAVLMESLRNDGRIFWDVCDPSWWWQPGECQAILAHADGVIACTDQLAADFQEWGGVLPRVIPDRLNLSHFTDQRQHRYVDPVRFIWFGVAVNRISLFSAVANLERLAANGNKIELTIMDDRPESPFLLSNLFPIYHTRWELGGETAVLSSHDVALLPPYPGPWGVVKSNNKHLTAWAYGLPVLSSDKWGDYQDVMNPRTRHVWATKGWELVQSDYTIEKTADQWEELLCK